MFVRRLVGAVMALLCVGLLSSCALLPKLPPSPLYDDSKQQSDVVMQHIADAVKSHDAAALKKLFSSRAREKANDLDSGLAYFLSVLPSGRMTWESEGTGSAGYNVYPTETEAALAFYKVSANGKEYTVYFDDLTVNTNDPKYVGIYALAVGPYNPEPATSPTAESDAFYVWANSHNLGDNDVVTGPPGVYVPQK